MSSTGERKDEFSKAMVDRGTGGCEVVAPSMKMGTTVEGMDGANLSAHHFVGLDLTWQSANRTGMAVVDESGRLRASGVVRSAEGIAEWLTLIEAHSAGVAVGGPLIEPKGTGPRALGRGGDGGRVGRDV